MGEAELDKPPAVVSARFRDLVLAQGLADDIEPARERGIAERPVRLPLETVTG
jgi:hypothetical protein